MKKSETKVCLIAGVLATSVLLAGCGGGSGGGMSGLGATGATGAGGITGATGTSGLTNLLDVLGPSGVNLNLSAAGLEDVNLRALSAADLADLTAAGFTGLDGVELLESNGTILGLQTPGGAFALPGVSLPVGLPTLPALPANVGNIISGLRL